MEDSIPNIADYLFAKDTVVSLGSEAIYEPHDYTEQVISILFPITLILVFLLIILGVYFYVKKKKSLRLLQELKNKNENFSQEIVETNYHLFTAQITTRNSYQALITLVDKHKDCINNQELVSPQLWEELTHDINKYANNFTTRLTDRFPTISKIEVHFCSLVKIGFKYSDIAILLGRTPNMMYKRRKAIIEKIGPISNPDKFEEFIRMF